MAQFDGEFKVYLNGLPVEAGGSIRIVDVRSDVAMRLEGNGIVALPDGEGNSLPWKFPLPAVFFTGTWAIKKARSAPVCLRRIRRFRRTPGA